MISLILPTFRRPKSLIMFMSSVFETTVNLDQLEIVFVLDRGDSLPEGMEIGALKYSIVYVPPNSSMGYMNQAGVRNSLGEIVMLVNDDLVFEVKGWDVIVRKTIGVKDFFYLWPDDGARSKLLTTFPIMPGALIRSEFLNSFIPEEYERLFIDVHLHSIFTGVQALSGYKVCERLDEFKVTHYHPSNGLKNPDKFYNYKSAALVDDLCYLSLTFVRLRLVKKLVTRFHPKIGGLAFKLLLSVYHYAIIIYRTIRLILGTIP